MSYNKTTWINDETPLNAENMNKIESGIEQNANDIDELKQSSGKQLYQHNIIVKGFSVGKVYLDIITDNATPITKLTDIASWLYNNGFTALTTAHDCSGGWFTGDDRHIYVSVFSSNGTQVQVQQITIATKPITVDDELYYAVSSAGQFDSSTYNGGGFDTSVSDVVVAL